MDFKELQEYNKKRDTARLAFINKEYGCCDTCGDSATNNDRIYLEGYDDGYNRAKLDFELNTLKDKSL